MIKSVIAISNHGRMIGGGEYSFFELLSNIANNLEINVTVPKQGELFDRLKKGGIESHIIPLAELRPWFIFKILRSLIAYLKICKKYSPDLIYSNGSRAAFYAGIVGRICKIPVIWHCRTADSDSFSDYILGKICNRIVTNSHATAKRFKKNLLPKISVVHNGVDIPWLTDRNVRKAEFVKDDWKVILVVARASKWKRHDLILAAFDKVAKLDPSVHLVCVGAKDNYEDEWWSQLQITTKKSPFSDRIHWIGKADDVRPWYRSAYVLVLSSENEAFGRVIVEAMSCGMPVIGPKSGGVPEIIRHGHDGFLTTAGDVEKISEYINLVLNENGLRKKLSKNAINRARQFNLDSHVKKMLEVFNKTIHPSFDA